MNVSQDEIAALLDRIESPPAAAPAPERRYFCNKCGRVNLTASDHRWVGCHYLAVEYPPAAAPAPEPVAAMIDEARTVISNMLDYMGWDNPESADARKFLDATDATPPAPPSVPPVSGADASPRGLDDAWAVGLRQTVAWLTTRTDKQAAEDTLETWTSPYAWDCAYSFVRQGLTRLYRDLRTLTATVTPDVDPNPSGGPTPERSREVPNDAPKE